MLAGMGHWALGMGNWVFLFSPSAPLLPLLPLLTNATVYFY
ncbi:hypothetical protein FDUTEX481_03705 [Tolypothrix sp. PCC 7601]|nr:hypothetical protein FDUTEX481_03705 [Tolypothrix sp. PCC 7601]